MAEGLLSTLQSGPGGHLTPVATPIVLSPTGKLDMSFGVIRKEDECYAPSKHLLDLLLAQSFARLIQP